MNNLDARSRQLQRLKLMLDSERKKWEFRYESQDKNVKELEATINRQKKKIRELRKELKDAN